MKGALFLIITVGLLSCNRSEKKETRLKQMNLYGQVKDLKEMSFNAILDSDTIANIEQRSENLFHFNKKGDIIEETISQYKDSSEVKIIYIYNNHQLNSEQLFYGFNGKLLLKNLLRYDNKGILLSQISFDEKNNEVAKANFDYDKLERLSKVSNYSYIQKNQWTELYLYNYIGKLKSKEFIPEQNNLRKIEFEYDSIGNLKVKYLFNVNNNCSKYFYKYSYDEKNNWTECIEMTENKVISIRTRLITYY